VLVLAAKSLVVNLQVLRKGPVDLEEIALLSEVS
jgi:hypothetical protein